MKIKTLFYQIQLINGLERAGVLVNIVDKDGKSGWGDIAPMPNFSTETLEQALKQLQTIHKIDWKAETYLRTLRQLPLYPSVTFGLESALHSIFSPLPSHSIPTSALLMGSPKEILEQADLRQSEGFTSAKLKVNNLSFKEAEQLIYLLKDRFFLRIDVNRAWDAANSLSFFSQFSKDAFDYIEEPFKNPLELAKFQHPLAIDESFPQDLCLEQLEELPMLKALIYKPTIQGGMHRCLPLHEWANKRGVSLILSSSFESDIGLAHIASMAHRLSLQSPIGIGTYHYMSKHLCPLTFLQASIQIPATFEPQAKHW